VSSKPRGPSPSARPRDSRSSARPSSSASRWSPAAVLPRLPGLITGLLLVAVGVIYIGRNLNLFEVDMIRFWNIFWPVVLILVAISLIRGSAVAGRGHTAFMGGIEQGGKSPWKLESGSYFAFMGGIDLDLTTAEIPLGETLLDISVVMGGVDIKIPRDLAVVYEGTVVMGGVSLAGQEDGGIFTGRRMEHNVKEHNERLLRVTGRVIMGGVDIKEG
jgi:hypothetical protein